MTPARVALRLSLTGLLIFACVAVSQAQDKQTPDKKTPDKKAPKKKVDESSEKPTALLFTMANSEGGRGVYKLTLKDQKETALIHTKDKKKRFGLFELSPSGTLGVAYVSGGESQGAVLYNLKTGKPAKAKLSKDCRLARFIDDDSVIQLEHLGTREEGFKVRLSHLELKTSKSKTITEMSGRVNMDMPLRLSPKGDFASFMRRSKAREIEGVRIVKLSDGTLLKAPEKLAYTVWSQDSKRLFAFSGEKRGLVTWLFSDKGEFSEEKSLSKDTAFLMRLDKGRFVGVRRDSKETGKTSLIVMDNSGKELYSLTDKPLLKDETIRQPAAYDASSGTVYFTELDEGQEPNLHRLIAKTIRDDKVTGRSVLKISEHRLCLPYLVK